MTTFFTNVRQTLTVPFSRLRRISTEKPHHHFYQDGFMADEIKALQSLFHSDITSRANKPK